MLLGRGSSKGGAFVRVRRFSPDSGRSRGLTISPVYKVVRVPRDIRIVYAAKIDV